MKTKNKILSAAVVIALIIPMMASAMWWWHWRWMWWWQWINISDEERDEIQSMTTEEKDAYRTAKQAEMWKTWTNSWSKRQGQWIWKSNSNHDIHECKLNLPEPQDLSDSEKDVLFFQYSEEMVARDAYNYLYDLYWNQTFANIAKSEQKHMDMVKKLIDRYWLETPTDYWVLNDTFLELKTYWEKWLKEAFEVWIKIEMLDIDDIEKEIVNNMDNDDMKLVFTNIWWASFNHLKWFVNALKNEWLTTDIDYSDYLSSDELNVRWWELKTKLAERLEDSWVSLPEWASSEEQLEKMNQNWWWHKWAHKWAHEWKHNWESVKKIKENWKEEWFFTGLFSKFIFWR